MSSMVKSEERWLVLVHLVHGMSRDPFPLNNNIFSRYIVRNRFRKEIISHFFALFSAVNAQNKVYDTVKARGISTLPIVNDRV